ncbi:KilA-N domain-containing protein [Erwinia sp. S43]|uniref:KilA-N domain-containing protein n=1 Tax=Erwinia sp. S43 TaxID=2769339 RepID=UPI00190D9A2F|nr:KilA-N domain-containing protein [Erwinia sp. S43]MBK0032728.1 KilA-N domain-containing protein [Erwinia sp. S43]
MNQLLVIDGVSVRQDKDGRYCLNDLHNAAGGVERHKPKFWLSNNQTQELVQELIEGGNPPSVEIQPVITIRGGLQQGTYVCKELVYSYAMWISAAFHLKVIRTFDTVVTGHANHSAHDMTQAGITLIGFMRKELNLSNSSVLGACQKLQSAVGLPNLAPQYAIDAPSDAVDGSSRPTTSLTTLLRDNQLSVTTAEAYKRLQHLGIVERLSRPSNSATARNGRKEFWSVTAKGMRFGKNMTSPGNPRETQPHFYTSTKAELIRLMLTSTKGE